MKISAFIPQIILAAYFALSGLVIWLAFAASHMQVGVELSDFMDMFGKKEPEPYVWTTRDKAYGLAALCWAGGLVYSLLKFKTARNKVYLIVLLTTIIIPLGVIYAMET